MPGHDKGERSRAGHVLFSVNSSWNVINFRAGLVRALLAEGYAVTVAAPRDEHSPAVEQLGCRYVELPMDAQGRSPVADLQLLARFVRLMRAERFDALLSFTPKPNIYGSIAARLCGVPAINNIPGLGLVFNERGPTSRILRAMYRPALRRSAHIFFQNEHDRALFERERLVDPAKTELLPGSGVDVSRFQPVPAAADPVPFVFLLVARLLWEKGIAELIEAGRLVRAQHPAIEIRILGFVEDGNPKFVRTDDLRQWQREGLATYLGPTSDVRPHLAEADCVVLPSYYPEGTPRALLEAAASGKPIITCDLPGCRNVVDNGENGFLVPPRDAGALADRMLAMIRLGADRRAAMGRHSRQIAETRFDEQLVIDRYTAALRRVVGKSR